MKKVLLLILVSFMFSVGMRFIYIEKIKDNNEFKYNNEYIINTNDGYYFGQGARDIISQKYKDNKERIKFDNSGVEVGLSKITALIVKTTGFKLETVMFYLSVFLSSLVVVPIILIGWTVGLLEVSFIAALLSSIAWSYYNRTMIGYYDTDMLNSVFPIFLLWSLIGAIVTKRSIYFLITAIEILMYRWWYPQSYSIEFSMIAILGLYLSTVIYFKKDYIINLKDKINLKQTREFYILLLSFMLISVSILPIYIILLLTIILYILYLKKREFIRQYIWIIFAISLVIIVATGGLNPIIGKLYTYLFSADVLEKGQSIQLNFFNVFKTISEASAIPLTTVANRISGSMFVFILSFVGFFMLLNKHRYFIFSLPLIGLGLLAYSSGLRFTIYAIVPLAFGITYLIAFIASYAVDNYKKENRFFSRKKLRYTILSILTIAVLYPNIKHLIDRNTRPVFVNSEIKTLDNLKQKAETKDYILSWWDYGYPLKFYSGLNTLVDGAVHHGDENFPVSYLLVQPQEKSAKMARLAVEYHEKRFNLPSDNPNKNRIDMEYMILDNGYKSANKFLDNIDKVKTPVKTRDIYLYLPDRMTPLLHVIEKFSNLNIENGESYQDSLFYFYQQYKISNSIVYITRHYKNDPFVNIDLKKGIFSYNNQHMPINKFIMTSYNKQGKLEINKHLFDISSDINIIYMQNYHRFIVLNDKLLNSTFIQLYVLENYDKELYEPVVMTPYVKIYKLLK